MGITDIIPDIHGQAAKLRASLDTLGWRRGPAGWRPPSPGRRILFLGDSIDRGPDNTAVKRQHRQQRPHWRACLGAGRRSR